MAREPMMSCTVCGDVDPLTGRSWQCQCGRAFRRKMNPEEVAEHERQFKKATP